MTKTVNWAVIGCGIISKSHCDAITSVNNSKLVAVCGIIEEKARKKANEYSVSKVYQDYRQLLKDPEIDVVSICTPSGLHGQMCIEAANAGKHILCEKPMEITKEKINQIVETIKTSKIKMGFIFQRRYDEYFIAAKNAIDSGRFGKVILADAYLKYYRNQQYYDSGNWRGTWELDGGGALMNQGVHGIDLLLLLAGDVKSVFARCTTQVRDIEVEDTAIASIEFKNGAIGNIECTTSVYPAQDTRIEIHCEKGSIIIGDSGIIQWEILGSDEQAPIIKAPVFQMKDDPTKIPNSSHFKPVEDMTNAIIQDISPAVGSIEARKAVDLILAIYQSSNEKREIIL